MQNLFLLRDTRDHFSPALFCISSQTTCYLFISSAHLLRLSSSGKFQLWIPLYCRNSPYTEKTQILFIEISLSFKMINSSERYLAINPHWLVYLVPQRCSFHYLPASLFYRTMWTNKLQCYTMVTCKVHFGCSLHS